MPKWEYWTKVVDSPLEAVLEGFLAKMGDDGWELVTVVGSRLYFKREKVEANHETPHKEG